MNSKQARVLFRITILVTLGFALLYLIRETIALVTAPAPFHQFYQGATDRQNSEVARRLVLTMLALPAVFAGILYATFPAYLLQHWSRILRLAGILIVSGGLIGWAMLLCLPYGFGSSYEHASAAQHEHLRICGKGGALLSIVGFLAVVTGNAIRKPKESIA